MTVDPTPSHSITVHYLIGDMVQVDTLTVPEGGSHTSQLHARGRSLVMVFDSDGRKVRGVQYRQAERIEVVMP